MIKVRILLEGDVECIPTLDLSNIHEFRLMIEDYRNKGWFFAYRNPINEKMCYLAPWKIVAFFEVRE